MWKYSLAFILLCGLQVHAQDSLKVNPDRPDVTNGTNTIQHGYLQVEHGSFFQKEKAGGETVNTYGLEDVTLRLGIVKKFEFDIHYLLEHERDDEFNTSRTGIASTNVGFKYGIGEQKGFLPSFSLAGGISLPYLTSRTFKPQYTQYTAALLFQHELKDWEIGYNLIFNKTINTPALWGYSISVRRDFNERLSGFVENYLYLQGGGADLNFDIGLGYSVTKLLMLDLAASAAANHNSHYITIGISYLIPKKLF